MNQRIAVFACALAVLVAAPVSAGTIQTFVLSNEGGLVNQLITAGYGDLAVYDALVQMQQDSSPAVTSVLTNAFLDTLQSLPAGSATFVTTMTQLAGETFAVAEDGTVQIVNVLGASYYNQPGTANIYSNISGVGSANFTYSTSDQPLTSWQSSGYTDQYGVWHGDTYSAFAVAWSPAAPTAAPEPSSLALLSIAGLAFAARMWWRSGRNWGASSPNHNN